MTWGCPWDYSARHYSFKTLNGQLNVVLGQPKGVGLLKHLGRLEIVPLKFQGG